LSTITTKRRLKIWSTVVGRQWWLSLLSGEVDARSMRAVAWSFAG
jgi:hypothetical protein